MLHDVPNGSARTLACERSPRFDAVPRRVALFLAALWLSTGCATIDPGQRAAEKAARQAAIEVAARVASGFVGVYAGRLPAASSAGRAITLELRADGRAQLVSVYLGRGVRAERGHWSAAADALRVEWEAFGDGPSSSPTEWLRAGPLLVPSVWDRSIWGDAGLPLTRWQASRAPRAGCGWRPFSDATLGIRLLVESCAPGASAAHFAARGAEIVDIADGDDARGTPVVQVFSKPALEPIDAAIRARFFPQMVPRMRAGCRVRRGASSDPGDPPSADASPETWEIVPTESYQEATAKWRAAEPNAMVCGPYGQRNGRGYFEFHPDVSTTRYLFVWLGADAPRFDEQSIELLN